MRRMRTLLGLTMVAVLIAPAVGGTYDEWLPEGTVFYASVEDVTALKTTMMDGPFGALMGEESMVDFLELPRQRFKEELDRITAELGGANPMELLGMIKGQVTLAFTGFRKTEGDKLQPGLVILADIGDSGDKLKEWLGRVEQADDFKSKHRIIEDEFRGTKIVSWIELDTGEDEADEEDEEVTPPIEGLPDFPIGEMQDCYFVSGNTFAFGSDPELLKDLLNRKGDAEAASLNGSEMYRTIRRRTGPDADAVFFLNIQEIWKIVGDKLEKNPKVATWMGALGLTKVQAMGGRMSMGKMDSDYHFFLYAPGEKTGVMKLLDGKNTALVPPKFVPEDAASAMTMAFDVKEIWAEAKRTMARVDEEIVKMLDMQLAGMKEQMGLDVEADLIGSFGKSMTLYQFTPEIDDEDEDVAPGPMAGGPASLLGRFVIAFELADAEKMSNCLDILLGMAPAGLEIEEYMGVTINSMNAGFFEVHFATAAGHLVVASQVEDLRAVIQTQGKEGKGLAGTEDFARGTAGLPESRSLISFSDPRKSVGMISDMMNQMGPMIMMTTPEIAEWIDFSLFPPAEVLRKYVDVGGMVMITEEDGVSLIGISRMKMPK